MLYYVIDGGYIKVRSDLLDYEDNGREIKEFAKKEDYEIAANGKEVLFSYIDEKSVQFLENDGIKLKTGNIYYEKKNGLFYIWTKSISSITNFITKYDIRRSIAAHKTQRISYITLPDKIEYVEKIDTWVKNGEIICCKDMPGGNVQKMNYFYYGEQHVVWTEDKATYCEFEDKYGKFFTRKDPGLKYMTATSLSGNNMSINEIYRAGDLQHSDLSKELVKKFGLDKSGESEEKHTEFTSGAKRGCGIDKEVRYDLITPIGLRALAATYAEGAEKYGDENWKKGIPKDNLLNHAMNHIEMWRNGDTSEPHLAHAVWNLMTIIHFEVEGWKA